MLYIKCTFIVHFLYTECTCHMYIKCTKNVYQDQVIKINLVCTSHIFLHIYWTFFVLSLFFIFIFFLNVHSTLNIFSTFFVYFFKHLLDIFCTSALLIFICIRLYPAVSGVHTYLLQFLVSFTTLEAEIKDNYLEKKTYRDGIRTDNGRIFFLVQRATTYAT